MRAQVPMQAGRENGSRDLGVIYAREVEFRRRAKSAVRVAINTRNRWFASHRRRKRCRCADAVGTLVGSLQLGRWWSERP